MPDHPLLLPPSERALQSLSISSYLCLFSIPILTTTGGANISLGFLFSFFTHWTLRPWEQGLALLLFLFFCAASQSVQSLRQCQHLSSSGLLGIPLISFQSLFLLTGNGTQKYIIKDLNWKILLITISKSPK